jgi:hypothetical protein
VKCYQYYPVGQDNEGDDEMVFNDVGLKVTFLAERHCNYHFTTRVLQLTDLVVSFTKLSSFFWHGKTLVFTLSHVLVDLIIFMWSSRCHYFYESGDVKKLVHAAFVIQAISEGYISFL